MNDDDFRDLIRLVQQELIASGAPDLADERNYVEEFGEGERIQLPPQKLLISMLKAFDRHMSFRDHATYVIAMNSIFETVSDRPPESAIFEQTPLRQFEERGPTVNLDDAPDLTPIRQELRNLIFALAEEPPRGAVF